jgi:hypothetical protein
MTVVLIGHVRWGNRDPRNWSKSLRRSGYIRMRLLAAMVGSYIYLRVNSTESIQCF